MGTLQIAQEPSRVTRLPDDQVMKIAARLRELRLAYDFPSALKWAEWTGISNTAYANYERGDRMISVPEAAKLSQATGVTFDWIYQGTEHSLPGHVTERLAAYRAGHKKQQRKR